VRHLILLGYAALLLSGCGAKDQSVENSDTATQTLTAETPPAGDTTAIDATTGADANLAAAAEIPVNEEDANTIDNSSRNSESITNEGEKPGN
jgi:hypothetical protein